MIALLLACHGGKGNTEISSIEAEVSERVPTVVTVRYQTGEDRAGRIVYDSASGTLETPWDEGGTRHEAVLLGLAQATEVGFHVELDDGSESDEKHVSTGSLTNDLPTLTTEGDGNEAWLLTPLIGNLTGPLLLAPDGQIAWFLKDERDLDVYRVRAARDGSGVIYNAASVSGDPADDSMLVQVSWDGATETTTPLPLLAHDFVELPDGTITAIVVHYGKNTDGDEIRGDALVEVAPDGTQTTVWTTWDCFDPDETPGDEPLLGWTFANALDYDEETDAYWLGIRNFSSIVRIDRATGACDPVIGSMGATVPIKGEAFAHQHQFDVEGDALLVFDNEGTGENASRAMEYRLAGGTATEIWRYEPDPSVYSFVLGDVHRFADGDTLVDFSVAGQIDRVDASGALRWRVNTALGYVFGFLAVMDTPYEEAP